MQGHNHETGELPVQRLGFYLAVVVHELEGTICGKILSKTPVQGKQIVKLTRFRKKASERPSFITEGVCKNSHRASRSQSSKILIAGEHPLPLASTWSLSIPRSNK